MAEVVELQLERMLPEYEMMRKEGLLSGQQIRTIKNQREKFSYKITKPGRVMLDYCSFIKFENDLLRMISAKSKAGKMTSVQFSIANNIKNLYNGGLKYFPQEIRFWEAYIKFLKNSKFMAEVSTAFEKMLIHHGGKPEVWVKAAVWEYEEAHNMERVKELFLRGLQKHPDSELLHANFFKVMLHEASKMSSEKNLQNFTESEQSLGLERVVVIYKSCQKKIDSVEYCSELLDICRVFPTLTASLQKLICDDMMKSFPRNPKLWHTLAQRELDGFNMCDLNEYLQNKDNKHLEETQSNKMDDDSNRDDTLIIRYPKNRPLKTRIEQCFDVYMTAVIELKSEEMWTLFLNAMLELNQNSSTQACLKRQKLGAAFRAAHEAKMMSEDHYYTYTELLMESRNNSDDFVEEVMKSATKRYSKSLKLWEQWINYLIRKENVVKLEEVFQNSCKNLEDESHPLWKLLLQFYCNCPDLFGKIQPLFQSACRKTSENFLEFRVLYLEYAAAECSIQKLREVYQELVNYPPPCLELHERMAHFESKQINPDITKWRQCHEYSVSLFGKTRTDVWLSFLRFERDYGEPKKVSPLFERAKETINTNLVDYLVSEFSLFMTGIL